MRRPAVIGLSVLALVGSAWGVGALVDRPETAAAVIDAGGATTPTAPVRVAAVAAPTTPPAPAPSTAPVAPVGAGPDAAPMPPVSALDADTEAGILTIDERARIALTRIVDPTSVPERYRATEAGLFPALEAAFEDYDALDAETQRWLAEQVTPDPEAALNPTILDADDIDAAYDALTPPG
ncbi:hypothetical protein [Cellulomonas sp. Root485]|uniref:hypothetical protein n=1 Tax=Cellulomonas sp. Root485 TaxID=1736546 RepID=UPI0012F8710C|nr:hypothetical protein [Cellulomonas sp. Root485]